MHGPDGADYKNESVFLEVVKPQRIVFQHLDPVHGFQITATFEEEDGKTRLTWRMLLESSAKCEEVKAFVTEANEENFDLERTPRNLDSNYAPRRSMPRKTLL